jgi:hypothetical protein
VGSDNIFPHILNFLNIEIHLNNIQNSVQTLEKTPRLLLNTFGEIIRVYSENPMKHISTLTEML